MKWMATPLLLLLVALAAQAQEEAPGYNPFVSDNLNDLTKVAEGTVVESSYRYFKVSGDPKFTDFSTFVWYVENGTFGTYDNMTDQWTPIAATGPISNGEYVNRPGAFVDGVGNSSEIWVKWDEDSGGKTGYVAVYERSSTNCILDNAITGFKLSIVAPPEAWFAEATQAECSDQEYSVELRFNHIYEHSYEYVLTYSYPNVDGGMENTGTLVIDNTMLTPNGDGTFTYMLDLNMIHDIDVTKDEVYTLELTRLRDKNFSEGNLRNNPAQNQHKMLNLTINHLPQTGGMTME